jgi:carotenoid cleavage dioxygenase
MLGMTRIGHFLQKNYAPIGDELSNVLLEHDATTNPLQEDFPNGMFVRNGPNPQFRPAGNYHWFDGDGMIHGVSFKDGVVKYNNRYIVTEKYKTEKEAGRSISLGLMDSGNPFVWLHKLFSKYVYGANHYPDKNPANTSLIHHAGKLLATFEGAMPYEIELPTLNTIGLHQFDKKYTGVSFTAHPKIDPVTGEMICFNYTFSQAPFIKYHIIDKDGQVTHSTPLEESPHVTMVHDFVITEKYTVFFFYSLVLDTKRVGRGLPPFYFDHDKPTKVCVIPRYFKTGDPTIQWFDVKPCMIFHHVNGYEQGNEIIVRTCRISEFSLEFNKEDREETKSTLYEYRFNLETKNVQEGPLLLRSENALEEAPHKLYCDFPVINSENVGRKNRYMWAARESPLGGFDLPTVIKVDLETLTYAEHACTGSSTGEWVHVSTGTNEDDGYMVGFMYNEKLNSSTVQIVRAKDMKGVTTYTLPRRIPYGFHGLFVSD